jgi:hypothetical protein
MFPHVLLHNSHRELRLGTLLMDEGGRPDAMREGHTQCSQPAHPTDPGDAADLGIPQGLEIGVGRRGCAQSPRHSDREHYSGPRK